jgi:hypothetical protein
MIDPSENFFQPFVAVFLDILGCQTPLCDPVATRDQPVDLQEVEAEDGLVFRQEGRLVSASSVCTRSEDSIGE